MTARLIDFRSSVSRLQPTYFASAKRATTLSRLLPLWLDTRRSDNRRPRGITTYQDKFEQFIAFAGDIAVEKIDEALVKDFKRDTAQRCAPGTVRNALTIVRSFCDWCVAEGYRQDNPAIRVPHPHVEDPNPDPLSREQVAELLAAVALPFKSHKWTQPRTYRLMVLMLNSGLRISEAAGLRMFDLDYDRRLLTVRREVAKNGQHRVIPINTVLLDELEKIRDFRRHWGVIDQGPYKDRLGEPLTYKSLAHIFERVLPRLVDFHIHSHQLRKTFATELYIQGEDLLTIQRLLGHKDPKTTMLYIGISGQREHAAVNRLSFTNGENTVEIE